MNIYTAALYVHISCVLVSIFFFILRGIWMIQDSYLLKLKLVRVLPHVVDSTLLLAAVVLTFITRQYPITHDWLTVKVVALVVYVLLGMVALGRGKTMKIRIVFFGFAIATFGFMLSVAYYHHPMGIFVHLVR